MNLIEAYPWMKALHVAAAITFVGGLLATRIGLSTLNGDGDLTPEQHHAITVLRTWETRLTTPAMLLVWILGLSLAVSAGWFRSGWLPAKLVFVILLSGLHGVQSGALRRLSGVRTRLRQTTLMTASILISTIAIALLAVTKPF